MTIFTTGGVPGAGGAASSSAARAPKAMSPANAANATKAPANQLVRVERARPAIRPEEWAPGELEMIKGYT